MVKNKKSLFYTKLFSYFFIFLAVVAIYSFDIALASSKTFTIK